jgi:tetratricopeptide (TPR) repeat protein
MRIAWAWDSFWATPAAGSIWAHWGMTKGFQAVFYMFGDSGKGAMVMANSANGILLGDYLIQRIATAFDWKELVAPDRPRIGPSAVLLLAEPKATAPGTIRAYQQLKQANSGDFAVNKQTLISVGYTFLNRDQIQDAIQVLKFEVEEFPEYWNTYHTLAELYVHAGNKELAILNYKKSLALNPDNQGAVKALQTLVRFTVWTEPSEPQRIRTIIVRESPAAMKP